MAKLNTLETLPTELKFFVLDRLADTRTLSALVHAVPAFHQLYRDATHRTRILTKFTLRDLRTRVQFMPTKEPTTRWELVVPSPTINPSLRTAIEGCCTQTLFAEGAKIILTVEQCIALQSILIIIRWVLEECMEGDNRFRSYVKGHGPSYSDIRGNPALARIQLAGSEEELSCLIAWGAPCRNRWLVNGYWFLDRILLEPRELEGRRGELVMI